MDRLPNAADLTASELKSLRSIVTRSFTPRGQVGRLEILRLLELGLIQDALGGLMPTPAGRIASRF